MNILSVVMPVFNAENYLDDAILSILGQSFSKFDFYIINDGSTDRSLSIMKIYKKLDDRIIIINQKNIGYTKSLIKVIAKIKTKYVARMDADDISHFKRFEYQLNYLKNNQKVKALGTGVNLINNKNIIYGNKLFMDNINEINTLINYETPISHPTAIFERSTYNLIGGYNASFEPAEDYRLWTNFIKNGYEISNLRMKLLKYRVHNNSVSNKRIEQAIINSIRSRRIFSNNPSDVSVLNIIEKNYYDCVSNKNYYIKMSRKKIQKLINSNPISQNDKTLKIYLLIRILIFKVSHSNFLDISKIIIYLLFKNSLLTFYIFKILIKSRLSLKNLF